MLELLIVGFLIVLNGVFALSELAVVSARKVRLEMLADRGVAGAQAAIALSESPGKFLSTVQIGITLVGIVAGAFSGATLGARMGQLLTGAGLRPDIAQPGGYALVIGIITYLSVIVGELVPKHLALKNPERIACFIARPMNILSRVAAPAVWLLDASTRGVFKLLGVSTASQSAITDEEILTIVAEAGSTGVIEEAERSMISGVIRLGDRSVRAVMTPRTDVEMVKVDEDVASLKGKLIASNHSCLPIFDEDRDNVIGVIMLKDMVEALLSSSRVVVRDHIRSAPVIPDTLDALAALKVLRNSDVPMALVHDEYGHFEGLLTPADILDAIAGAFRSDEDQGEPEAVRRDDGSWLLAGWMPADEMAELLGIDLPKTRHYETVAGFIIDRLERIPETGEAINFDEWRFEVVDLDHRRVDKVLASRI
ncbi:hemolysin family protein (plasmid) [Phyllobacterium sp. A18/5-2]|uniref:hemolysin family protein n=1 Tax=Phyllobacterium sp. A18/5-2 TaxID=2978392 RepID=UPI0021C8396C|nr:hemolysin family protein [Phyllobacterium sp. A18/5-2]UXN66821.1 hemolysin family protein [Phyllobacterium sp. A18/5-2]